MKNAEKIIQPATIAAERLAQSMISDLNIDTGGFSSWQNYDLSLQVRCILSDYLIDVTQAVSRNLSSASHHLKLYSEKRFSEDIKLRNRVRQTGYLFDSGNRENHEHSANYLVAEMDAFTSSISSVLDTLAGTIIGVGGFRAKLQKADFQQLGHMRSASEPLDRNVRKIMSNEDASYIEQENLLRAVQSSIIGAGPRDWHVWSLRMRNSVVHRGRQIRFTAIYQKKQTDLINPHEMLPLDPALTTAQMLAKNQHSASNAFIFEDAVDTLTGILESASLATTEIL